MNRKKIAIRILLVFSLIFFAGVQVAILNKFSTTGEKLTFFISQIDEIQAENSRLTQKIASSSAIAVISEKAQSLGFDSNLQTLSLSTPLKVAKVSDSSLKR